MGVKLSIGTWAYTFDALSRKNFCMEEMVKRISKLGFDGLALSGFKPQGHYEIYPTIKERKKLCDIIRYYGLEINSYSADLRDFPFYTGDREAVRNYDEAYDRCLEFCVDCKIPLIRVDTVAPTPYPHNFEYKRVWDNVVKMFRKDAEKAMKVNMIVVWEFEPGFIFNKPSEIVRIVKDVNVKNFKLLYDTCHAQMCSVVGANQYGEKQTLKGGQLEFINVLEGMIGDVHLIDSDNTLRDIRNSNHAPFGTGFLNFEELIPALKNACYMPEWWTIDLGTRSDAWELTGKSKNYMNAVFKRLEMK